LSKLDLKPTDETADPVVVSEEDERREPPAEEPEGFDEEGLTPPRPDFSLARSLLTELVPAGIGEVLVTDIWGRPETKATKSDEQADRQRAWELRQEMRDLGVLKERPMVSYDARVEQYWSLAREARIQAGDAITDPYTELVTSFADVDLVGMSDHYRAARDYSQRAEALLKLGQCYLAIGKFKGAKNAFQAAARAEPHDPQIWWHLGVAHLFTRANRPAVTGLQRALDQAPGDLRTEMALGLAHYHLRNYAEAEEQFRRQAGNTGLHAAIRSMLACCLRMQQKWDDARIELGFLRQSRSGDWPVVAEQCVDCVERGEQKREGPIRHRRRIRQMLKALAGAAGGGIWAAYAKAENLFHEQAPWAAIPLFLAALLLTRGIRGMSSKELPGEFGNLEQGLPCWQATTWMRPRRSGL